MSASTWLYSDDEVPEPKPEMLVGGFRQATPMSPDRCFSCDWCEPSKAMSTGVVLMACTQWFHEVADNMICDAYSRSEEAA